MVEVAYVCSSDYWRQLFLSIRSLYASDSHFDSVRIFVTGEDKPNWKFGDDRIKLTSVPDIGSGFWMLNKTHVCNSKYETVILLDVDTLVLGKIDTVYSRGGVDVIARCAPRVKAGYHDEEQWKQRISRFGCSDYPYLSSGFVVFQNGSHRRIKESWIDITKKILKGEGDEEPDWHANQDAFSIACCAEGVDLGLMKEKEHAYAMIGEEPEGATVYHLGTPNFYHYYFRAEEYLGVDEQEAPVAKPRFLRFHRFKNRLTRKMKRIWGANRETKPDWSES
jgi:hypothetical protein